MKKLDFALGSFLVVLGCLHNFIAAPLTYDRLTTQAFWFVAAGLALWYAGFLNLLRTLTNQAEPLLLGFCATTNLSLLVFVTMFAVARGAKLSPQAIALIATVLALTVISVRALIRKPSAN